MLCYKDATFCDYLECKNISCERRLTEHVKSLARRWWGNDNPPICIFTEKPGCYENE
jgi:hypothetical protein